MVCVDSLENECKCQNQFNCFSNTTCINPQYVCDQVLDCPDGSDEINCSKNSY
jgi:hypothetical protein